MRGGAKLAGHVVFAVLSALFSPELIHQPRLDECPFSAFFPLEEPSLPECQLLLGDVSSDLVVSRPLRDDPESPPEADPEKNSADEAKDDARKKGRPQL